MHLSHLLLDSYTKTRKMVCWLEQDDDSWSKREQQRSEKILIVFCVGLTHHFLLKEKFIRARRWKCFLSVKNN